MGELMRQLFSGGPGVASEDQIVFAIKHTEEVIENLKKGNFTFGSGIGSHSYYFLFHTKGVLIPGEYFTKSVWSKGSYDERKDKTQAEMAISYGENIVLPNLKKALSERRM